MLDAVLNRLDMAEHHSGGGVQTHAMCNVHDFEPIVAHRFEGGDALTDPVHQDFAAAAGYRTQARGFEIGDNLVERFVEHLAEMNEFAGTEAMNVDQWKLRFNVPEQVQIPLLGELGMMAALHQNLRAA